MGTYKYPYTEKKLYSNLPNRVEIQSKILKIWILKFTLIANIYTI